MWPHSPISANSADFAVYSSQIHVTPTLAKKMVSALTMKGMVRYIALGRTTIAIPKHLYPVHPNIGV
jgi:hypothetical protein